MREGKQKETRRFKQHRRLWNLRQISSVDPPLHNRNLHLLYQVTDAQAAALEYAEKILKEQTAAEQAEAAVEHGEKPKKGAAES